MVECFTGNKKCDYVPYARWLALLLARTTGYYINHGESMPFPVISSKIIHVFLAGEDPRLTQYMKNQVHNPYEIEDPLAPHMENSRG